MKLVLIFILIFIISFTNAYSEELLYHTSDNVEVSKFNKLAWDEFLQSNFLDSISLFDKALEIEPDNTYALLHQGYAHVELDKLIDARSNYKKIFEKFPIHLTGFNAIGDTYILEDDFSMAQIWFEKTLHENQFEPYALLRMADIQLKKGNYNDAILEYDKILSLKPSEQRIITNAQLGKGISYFHLNNHLLAQQEFSNVVKQGNIVEKIIGHNYMGLSLKATGNVFDAKKEFEQAKSFDRESIILQTEKNKIKKIEQLVREGFGFWDYTNHPKSDNEIVSPKTADIIIFLVIIGIITYAIYGIILKIRK